LVIYKDYTELYGQQNVKLFGIIYCYQELEARWFCITRHLGILPYVYDNVLSTNNSD